MLRFRDVAIVVKDAQRSFQWYTKVLGLAPGENEGHWVTVRPPRSTVVLHLCEYRPLERGNTGVGFVVADVARAEKELRAKGVKFTQKTTKAPWGTYAMFRDPDGNEFWLSESG